MPPSPFTLNPEQEAAVTHMDGPLLIIAGAGTGKTRVITERIAYLLEHMPDLLPPHIVALTFTDRATEEMSSRIRTRVDAKGEGEVCVRTFHSFALLLVQEQASRLHRRSEVQLLNNEDFYVLLRRHIEKLRLEVFWKNADPGKFLRDLIEFMSRAHDELVSVSDYETYVRHLELNLQADLAAGRITRIDVDEQLRREREIARVYRVATELLSEAGAQTYGDVITTAVRLLKEHPEVRTHYQNRYRVLLVDEFQDTNVAQIELLDLLAQSHQNITVVGDDDQSIYRFRGASSESFNLFARKFPRFRQLKLTQNYRSTQRILRVANQLITVNQDRFDAEKNLWTEHEEGEGVRLFESPEPDDEALAVAEQIDHLHDAGRPWRDIAVLYRAHSNRDLLIKTLRRRAIPFQVVGLSVLNRPAVRDLMAAARIVVNVHDSIACARMIAHPRFHFAEGEFVSFTTRAARHPKKDQSGRPSLYEVIQTSATMETREDTQTRIRAFETWVESLRRNLAKRSALAALKVLAAELTSTQTTLQKDLWDAVTVRVESFEKPVRRVLEFVEEWQKKNPHTTLKDFLNYFELFREAGGDIAESQKELPGIDAVRLMTVHAAKGLEFPVVFVLRLTQTNFPSRRRTPLLPFPEALRKEGLLPPGDTHTQEERRLCYVALTRAEERLLLSSVVKPRMKPSEFLADLQRHKKRGEEDLTLTRVPPSGEDLTNELALDPQTDETAFRTSRLPLWALRNAPLSGNDPEPVRPDALKLSASSMESFKTCPLQYKFSHEYRLSGGPSAALTVGAVLHECVKLFFELKKNEPDFPRDKMEKLLEERWRTVGFEDDYQQQRYRRDAAEQLRQFYDKNIDEDVNVLAQERTFEFRMKDFTVIGRIDQMNKGPDDSVELIDYKTGSPKEQRDADHSLQLSVYALACQEAFHYPSPRLSFYNLQNGEKVVTERSAAQLEIDRAAMVGMAGGIRNRRFVPRKGYHCTWCDFASLCPAWEEWKE